MIEFQHEFEHQKTFSLGEFPCSQALSPDGKWLVTGSRKGGKVKVWDTHTGQLVRSWIAVPLSAYPYINETSSSYEISALAISPDGKTLVTGGCILKAWEFETGKQIRIFKGCGNWIPYTTISSDSQILVTEGGLGNKGTIIIWDLKRGKKIRRYMVTVTVKWVVSPDSKTVVGEESFDGLIKVWDVITGETLRTLDNSYGITVRQLAFSQDGKILAGSGFDGIKIWDFATGKQIQRIEKYRNVQFHNHLDNVFSLMFSPNGKNLLSCGSDGLIQIWDVGTGKNAGTLQGEDRITWIAMSSDARTLLSIGGSIKNEGTIDVWRIPQ